MQKAGCEEVSVSSGYEVMVTIKAITPHIFPLERGEATLFDEYGELITMPEELERLRTGPPLCALKMYINHYHPCLTDKSGLVATAGYLNPKTSEGVREMYDGGISAIEKDILDVACGWNILLTPEHLESCVTRTYPSDFREELGGKGAWEKLMARNRTQSTHEMYSFITTLLTVSPLVLRRRTLLDREANTHEYCKQDEFPESRRHIASGVQQ